MSKSKKVTVKMRDGTTQVFNKWGDTTAYVKTEYNKDWLIVTVNGETKAIPSANIAEVEEKEYIYHG